MSFEGSFKIECYEGSALLVNNLVVVTSRENNKMKSFTAYKTRSDLTIGKTVTLFTLPASNKLTSKIEVYSSENNEYLLTVARNTDAYGKFDEYHYHVLDKNFETVVQGVNKLPGSKHANDKDFHYVSNTGEYFIGFKTYDANVNNRGKENKTKKTYSNYLIRRVNVEATRDFEIVLKQGYVKSLGFKVDEKKSADYQGFMWRRVQ